VLHAVFLCLDTAGKPVTATYTWFDESGPMPCDPGPDTVNPSVAQCGTRDGSVCPGRAVNTFKFGNSATTVMPRIEIPRGASWELFAWLAPASSQPGAGVSPGGAGLARFTGYGLSFAYPRSWHSLTNTQQGDDNVTTLAFQGLS
jgi:hypothetical protein